MSLVRARQLASRLVPISIKHSLLRRIPDITASISQIIEGTLSLWNNDDEFLRIYRSVEKRTLLDKKKAYILYKIARQCRSLDGAYAELGVYLGGGAKLINAAVFSAKRFYVFDTFKGLPEVIGEHDNYWQKGDMREAVLSDVQTFLSEESFTFCPGFFPETSSLVEPFEQFAFVHIDMDIYQSVTDACHFFYGRLVRGGILLFDDYGFLPCPGVRKAVDEFFADKAEIPIYLATGQCMVVKLT